MLKKQILIVDDRKDIRDMLVLSLKSNGYMVKTAKNAKDCFEVLKNNKIDLILLDIMMPEISGIMVLKKIRANDKYSSIKIIMLSALHPSPNEMKSILKHGAQAILEKPISLEQLSLEIKKTLKS